MVRMSLSEVPYCTLYDSLNIGHFGQIPMSNTDHNHKWNTSTAVLEVPFSSDWQYFFMFFFVDSNMFHVYLSYEDDMHDYIMFWFQIKKKMWKQIFFQFFYQCKSLSQFFFISFVGFRLCVVFETEIVPKWQFSRGHTNHNKGSLITVYVPFERNWLKF